MLAAKKLRIPTPIEARIPFAELYLTFRKCFLQKKTALIGIFQPTPSLFFLFFFCFFPEVDAHLIIYRIDRDRKAQRDARERPSRRDAESFVRLPADPNTRQHRRRNGSPDTRKICGHPKPTQNLLATGFFLLRHAKGTGGFFRFPYR